MKAKLEDAVRKAFDSKEFTEFMDGRGFTKTWKSSADAREFHKEQDKSIGDIMKAVGL